MAEKPVTLPERRGKTEFSPFEYVEAGAGQVEGVDTNEVLNWVQAQTQTSSVTLWDRTISVTLKEKP